MYQKLTNTGNSQKLPIPQDAWLLFQADNHEVIRLNLEPGEGMEKHALDWRIIFYVLDGTGTLTIGDEVFSLKAHESIAVQPGLMREWKNEGDQALKLLAIKTLEAT